MPTLAQLKSGLIDSPSRYGAEAPTAEGQKRSEAFSMVAWRWAEHRQSQRAEAEGLQIDPDKHDS
jgi:hypothetical protein